MRTTALALALLAALALPAQAQDMTFAEDYQVRGAVGDIPTTPQPEAAGAWNVEQLLKVDFDNQSAEADRTYHFTLPSGAALANATCDCARATHTLVGTAVAFRIEPQTASGERTIRIVSRQPFAQTFAFDLPQAPTDGPVGLALYVPGGTGVASNLDLDEVGTAPSNPTLVIHAAHLGSLPDGTWFAIHPATEAADPATGGEGADGAGLGGWLLPAMLGLVLGILLWSVLVSRGVVQKKSRKQVAATAAHVEAAATDPPAVLEGKKRALLAALKEVELARQANEMPTEVYDAVKADLKKQAVTVMRALETGANDPKS